MELKPLKETKNTSAPSSPTKIATEESYSGSLNKNTRNNKRNRRYNRKNNGDLNKSPTNDFEIIRDELKIHVYNFTNTKETEKSFSTTIEEISEYIGRK